jgi:hypothetical protein
MKHSFLRLLVICCCVGTILFIGVFVAMSTNSLQKPEVRAHETDEERVDRLLNAYRLGGGEKDAAQFELKEMGDRAKPILVRRLNDTRTPYLEQGDVAWVMLVCFRDDSRIVDEVERFSMNLKNEKDRTSMLSLVKLAREDVERSRKSEERK